MADTVDISWHVELSITQLNIQMKLGNAKAIKAGDGGESPPFEYYGFKWRMAYLCSTSNDGRHEDLEVFLISQNPQGVAADVDLTSKTREMPLVQAENEVAHPFTPICKKCIPIYDLSKSPKEFLLADELVFEVNLKNIKDASSEEQRGKAYDLSAVKLEVIDGRSIMTWLNRGKAFGLGPSTREHDSDLCGCSFARYWATNFQDRRYWLCKRLPVGTLSVERCLNGTDPLERVGEISEEDGQGSKWITVFEEKKPSSKAFDPTDDDAVVVFCKVWEQNCKDLSYLGHVLVQKSTLCQELLNKLSAETARFPDDTRFNAYLETGDGTIEDITSFQTTVDECGVGSGSIIILIRRKRNQPAPALSDIQVKLRQIHGLPQIEPEARKSGGATDSSTKRGGGGTACMEEARNDSGQRKNQGSSNRKAIPRSQSAFAGTHNNMSEPTN